MIPITQFKKRSITKIFGAAFLPFLIHMFFSLKK